MNREKARACQQLQDNADVCRFEHVLHACTPQVSLSTAVMPMVKMVPRGFTAAADAYLTPGILRSVKCLSPNSKSVGQTRSAALHHDSLGHSDPAASLVVSCLDGSVLGLWQKVGTLPLSKSSDQQETSNTVCPRPQH